MPQSCRNLCYTSNSINNCIKLCCLSSCSGLFYCWFTYRSILFTYRIRNFHYMFLTVLRAKLFLWIPTFWSKIIFQKISNLSKVRKQSRDKKSLRKANVEPCRITCRFQLDIGPGTTESAVEFNLTLYLNRLTQCTYISWYTYTDTSKKVTYGEVE
jgi:hypothetical protein